jgi:hypothetical protein
MMYGLFLSVVFRRSTRTHGHARWSLDGTFARRCLGPQHLGNLCVNVARLGAGLAQILDEAQDAPPARTVSIVRLLGAAARAPVYCVFAEEQ